MNQPTIAWIRFCCAKSCRELSGFIVENSPVTVGKDIMVRISGFPSESIYPSIQPTNQPTNPPPPPPATTTTTTAAATTTTTTTTTRDFTSQTKLAISVAYHPSSCVLKTTLSTSANLQEKLDRDAQLEYEQPGCKWVSMKSSLFRNVPQGLGVDCNGRMFNRIWFRNPTGFFGNGDKWGPMMVCWDWGLEAWLSPWILDKL